MNHASRFGAGLDVEDRGIGNREQTEGPRTKRWAFCLLGDGEILASLARSHESSTPLFFGDAEEPRGAALLPERLRGVRSSSASQHRFQSVRALVQSLSSHIAIAIDR